MAIEMYAGKTGERLIAREPIDPSAYVDVQLAKSALVRLRYIGGHANGYPALSPELPTLDAVEPELRGYIQNGYRHMKDKALRDQEEESEAIRQVQAALEGKGDQSEQLARALLGLFAKSQAVGHQDIESSLSVPPVCPRIMPNKTMQLILPKPIFPQGNKFDLGVVEGIEINN